MLCRVLRCADLAGKAWFIFDLDGTEWYQACSRSLEGQLVAGQHKEQELRAELHQLQQKQQDTANTQHQLDDLRTELQHLRLYLRQCNIACQAAAEAAVSGYTDQLILQTEAALYHAAADALGAAVVIAKGLTLRFR